ncbi:MAG: DUF4276 family protein [Candidatus Coatesbacteria bacterium]|nr:DUF4276 family protein [Candidatus Coatesbacteria bacterium]
MVRTIFIYIEGGGLEDGDKIDRKGTQNAAALREGFGSFFRRIKGPDRQKVIECVSCGPRGEGFRHYRRGQVSDSDSIHILLIDSEGPVATSCWEHLHESRRDNWGIEVREEDDRCIHLMVQAMEAWLIVDRANLRDFYGAGFKESCLPDINIPALSTNDARNLEEIPKNLLPIKLKAATRDSEKGKYKKTHAFSIIKRLNPSELRRAAPHCERLFSVLEKIVYTLDE